jgi:hypothetical protein
MPEEQDRVLSLYKWARDAGLGLSRGEISDQILTGALCPKLAQLESTMLGNLEKCSAFISSLGNTAALEAQLQAHPELLALPASLWAGGEMPLHVAARLGLVDSIRMLAAAGADMEAKSLGRTALQVCLGLNSHRFKRLLARTPNHQAIRHEVMVIFCVEGDKEMQMDASFLRQWGAAALLPRLVHHVLPFGSRRSPERLSSVTPRLFCCSWM